MKYNHVAVYVSDMDAAKRLYCDFLGFVPVWDQVFPNEVMSQEVLDACFRMEGVTLRDVFCISPEGQKLELVLPIHPAPVRTARSGDGYPNTGFKELAFDVTDIDMWYDKVKDAGYEPLTSFVWSIAGVLRSFLFYDADGNAVQFVEEAPVPASAPLPA